MPAASNVSSVFNILFVFCQSKHDKAVKTLTQSSAHWSVLKYDVVITQWAEQNKQNLCLFRVIYYFYKFFRIEIFTTHLDNVIVYRKLPDLHYIIPLLRILALARWLSRARRII